MENHKNPTSPTNSQLCTAGCGFYGSEHFHGLCSKCYGAKNTGTSSKPISSDSTQLATADHFTLDKHKQPDVPNLDDTTTLRRKRPRLSSSSSIISNEIEYTKMSPTTSSSTSPNIIKSITPTSGTITTTPNKAIPTTIINTDTSTIVPNTVTSTTTPNTTTIPKLVTTPNTADSSEANTPKDADKPAQLNKSRCFKCRIKVPLVKQTINKCRCDYVFCDSHRFPDRHDCDVDYAKIGRDLLAKNNPKLHERPKGGRSFKRIDSL